VGDDAVWCACIGGKLLCPSAPDGRIDILEHWGDIEADFQTEYRIDLQSAFSSMTWRRFRILLTRLSGYSRLLGPYRSSTPMITDPDEAERVFLRWAQQR